RSPAMLRRLRWTWLPGNIGFNLVWGAVTGILMALQVQEIDPDGKVFNLALLTGAGAAMTMVVQPIAGRLSDRTRSRLGRRTPWILGGALAGGAAMVAMSQAETVPELLVTYLLVVIGYTAALLPLSAILPDRVPAAERGTFASLASGGQLTGTFGGQILASRLSDTPDLAYWLVAGAALVIAVAFVAFNPERPATGLPAGPLGWKALLRSYWVDPRANPDFAWVFAGRFLLMAGYFVSHSYTLYILQDYIGLGDTAADWVPALGITTMVTVVLFTAVGGPLSDRTGRRKVFIYVAGAVFAVGLAIPFLVPTLQGMSASAVVGGVDYGALASVAGARLTEVLCAEEGYGKDLGVIHLAFSLPQTCGSLRAGGIVGLAGGYAPLFPVGAVLAVAGGFALRLGKGVRCTGPRPNARAPSPGMPRRPTG